MAGAEAVEQRFAQARGEAVGNEHHQRDADDGKQCLAPRAVFQKDIQQHQHHGNPCAGTGDHEETVVQECAVAAVKQQEQPLVKSNQFIHTILSINVYGNHLIAHHDGRKSTNKN